MLLPKDAKYAITDYSSVISRGKKLLVSRKKHNYLILITTLPCSRSSL